MKYIPAHPEYIVRYKQGRRKSDLSKVHIWNGKDPLPIGFPVRYLLQKKGDRIFIRDFSTQEGVKTKLLLSHPHISIEPIYAPPSISWDQIARVGTVDLAEAAEPQLEETYFKKQMQRIGGTFIAILLLIFIFKPHEDVKTNEELIPKKYAKLIMTKPKVNQESAGGSSRSQGQAKAVAQVFKSAAVQKSLQTILKGGLSKYSIMSTGKAIQSLSQAVNSQQSGTSTNLQAKAGNLLAGANTGPVQVGNGSGYGTGNGTNVNGQGNGQLDIGLNTADASVDEGLTKDEVAKVIHAHINEIRFCYEAAILRDPALAGKVMIDFKINPAGMVGTANTGEVTLSDRQVGTCLMGKLKTWKFPNPRGGVHVAVSYPFVFKSLAR